MILAAPLLLLGLLALPLIWLLLRALPPAPRRQDFPAIRLLGGLRAVRQDADRAPPWLLLLRLAAGLLLVLGLAQPVLVHGPGATARTDDGKLLIVLDDGWAASADWQARIGVVETLLDRAERHGQKAMLMATAADESGAIQPPTDAATPATLRTMIAAIRPRAWNGDRGQAARVLRDWRARTRGPVAVTYVSDGLATGDDALLARTLVSIGPVREWRGDPGRLALLLPPLSRPDGLEVRVGVLKLASGRDARPFTVQAQDNDGATLARVEGAIAPDGAGGAVRLVLPVELRNRIARLALDGTPGPAGLRLLDEGDRKRPVGLIDTGGFTDAPLLGPLFYLRRALVADTELRSGEVQALLSRQLSVLIATDGTLSDEAVRRKVAGWVQAGGMLIRFAGPELAASDAGTSDAGTLDAAPLSAAPLSAIDALPAPSLLPEPLLDGARTLGGSMSWSHPETLAGFAADSPFAGLQAPADIAVTRQVLARPATDLDQKSWARLADGTPLVTHAALGAGQVVLFHVTSTADWSNLPFSGLFVQMLHRLVERAAGVQVQGGDAMLAPVSILDGDGVAGAPPAAARGLAADQFGQVPATAEHPPGLYGPPSNRRALNVGDGLQPLAVAALFGAPSDLAAASPDLPLGPWLLAAALIVLALDLMATLWLRGMLARSFLVAAGLMLGAAAWAGPSQAAAPPPGAALQTRLGYVVTGDAQTDTVSREGLEGLSDYVNARTSAVLGHPDAVRPGQDDLAFYPLLYWPITSNTRADPAAIAALNLYMSRGGMLLIDTKGSPEPSENGNRFTGLDSVGPSTLRQATAGLDIPPLVAIDGSHVLSHSFYLLHGFPGRYVGAPVWVAATGDQGEAVSPLILGANDWASAWAIDENGDTPFAAIPDGETQRTQAYRFGVNAVIYALTGNYKSDQVHVPALLERLGE